MEGRILIAALMVLLIIPGLSFGGSKFGDAFEYGAGWELGRMAVGLGTALIGGVIFTGYTPYHSGYYYERSVRYERPIHYYSVYYYDDRYAYGRKAYRSGYRDGYDTGYADGYHDGSYGYGYGR